MADLTDAQKSAQGIINEALAPFGLANIGASLWNQFLSGMPLETVLGSNLRATPEWQSRFKAIVDFQKKYPDLRPPTEADVLNYERTAAAAAHQYGLPPEMLDRAATDKFLAGNTSAVEMVERIKLAGDASHNMTPEERSWLHDVYGIAPGSGEATTYWLDPNKALPLLQRQFDAGKLGGAALRTGYGGIDAQTAEGLTMQGVSQQQATAGFGQLASERELFNPLNAGEDKITQQTQLGAAFGNDAAAKMRIQRRAAQRVASFDAGGRYAESQRGVTGLGAIQE